jgi:lipase
VTLAFHEWGERGAPVVVCLHGITGHGRHFAQLAGRLADRFHVVALDLRGHGGSPFEPPWNLEQHVEDALDTLTGEGLVDEPIRWIGHSFGGRVAFEVAVAAPEAVARLVLLDPALLISGNAAVNGAEGARADRSYVSFEEAIDWRFEESRLSRAPRELVAGELALHLFEDTDGRWRYRYLQSAVVAAYGEMSREPPPFELARVPTLLVLGEESYIPYDHLLDAHTAALGDELEVVRVPGGHTVLWDALAETGDAVEAFLLGG